MLSYLKKIMDLMISIERDLDVPFEDREKIIEEAAKVLELLLKVKKESKK